MKYWFAFFLLLVASGARAQQQVNDPNADVTVFRPAYGREAGPTVAVDAAHNNFHTAGGNFKPFADLLRNDGFKVAENTGAFSPEGLAGANILVVANALNAVNVNHWQSPTPSAFTPEEVAAVKAWVDGGGSLLLIADHFPFAGAASDLGVALGFSFINGFALADPPQQADVFTRAENTLRDDAITRGLRSVMTFTGSAFTAPSARPLLVFPPSYKVLMPQVAWEFTASTPRRDASGAFQGAVRSLGRGRVAVFGEAGMFTAQVVLPEQTRFGFNAPGAKDNKLFILGVMHWLAGNLGP